MVIFVEYVFINEVIINFSLLKASSSMSRSRTSFQRLLFSSILGGVIGLTFPIYKGNLFATLIKICCGLIVVLFSIKYEKLKEYILSSLYYFVFILAVFLICLLMKEKTKFDYNIKIFIYLKCIPISVIIGIFYCLLTKIKKQKLSSIFEYKFKLIIDEMIYVGIGFMDTGNMIFDGVNPVVVCNKKLSQKILNGQKSHRTYALNLTTMSGTSKIKVIRNADILIYFGKEIHTYKNVTVGLSSRSIKSDLILHPLLLKGE